MKKILIILFVMLIVIMIPSPCHATTYYFNPLSDWLTDLLVDIHLQALEYFHIPIDHPLILHFETTMPNGDIYLWDEVVY